MTNRLAAPLAFVAYGHPMPKGSKTHVGNGVMIEGSPSHSKDPVKRKAQRKRMNDWPPAVKESAQRATEAAKYHHQTAFPIDGPVNVAAVFYFPRPKHETRAQRQRKFHTGKPDLDKLLRGVLDPMKNAGVFKDDSRVVMFNGSEKRYVDWIDGGPRMAEGMFSPRVEVIVTSIAESS